MLDGFASLHGLPGAQLLAVHPGRAHPLVDWYGLNPGSETAIGTSSPVAVAAVATTLAPYAAGLIALVVKAMLVRFRTGARHYDLTASGNGILADLDTTISPCSTVYPRAAIIIGGVAGVLYCIGSEVSILLHLKDPLDAIAVHCWNGAWPDRPGLCSAQDLIQNAYDTIPTIADPRLHYGCFVGGPARRAAHRRPLHCRLGGGEHGHRLRHP